MRQKIIYRLLALSLLIFGLSSCVSEHMESQPRKGQEPTVTFSLRVPKASKPATRSLTDADEYSVKEIDVILFKDGKYHANRAAKSIGNPTASNNGGATLRFEVDLPQGDFDIVVIANGRQSIVDAQLKPTDDKYDALNRLIYPLGDNEKWTNNRIPMWGYRDDVTIEENTNLSGDNAIYMVRMVAKVEVKLLDAAAGVDNANFAISELYLYNYNTAGTLVPNLTDGWQEAKTEGGIEYQPKATKPNVPTVANRVKGPLKYTAGDDQTSEGHFTASEVTNTVYTFESEAGALNDSKNNPCVVIGGSYKGGATSYYRVDFLDRDANSTPMPILRNHSYNFVISAVTGDGQTTPEDAFNAGPVNIQANVLKWDISEMGDIVFDGKNFLSINPREIEHSREAVAEQKISVKTDYIMDNLDFRVSASYADPNAPLPENWLVLSGTAPEKDIEVGGYPAKEYTISYSTTENSFNKTRKAYIHVKVGRLHNVIEVTQSSVLGISVKFQRENANGDWEDVSSLHFAQPQAGVAPEAQKYRVLWSPASEKLTLTMSGATNGNHEIAWVDDGTYDVPTGVEINDGSGGRVFYVKPTAIAQYERGSFIGANAMIKARVDAGIDVVVKGLDIQQFVEDIWIEPSVQIMDGKETHYVTVKSNVPWELYANKNMSFGSGTADVPVVSELNGAPLAPIPNPSNDFNKPYGEPIFGNGEFNLPNGTDIQITTVDDITVKPRPHIYTGHLGLYAVSKENSALNDGKGLLCASGIPQDGREANCYVLDPTSGVGLLIPVRAANGVMYDNYNKFHNGNPLYNGGVTITPKIGSSNPNYGAKLVWADECGSTGKGIESDALLSLVIPAGSGEDGYILVMPGDAQREGNAVVAVTRKDAENDADKGEILWSWHIWVTKGMKFEGNEVMQTRVMAGENGVDPSGDQYWLDRNLGALNNGGVGKTNADTYGLHYQWGRKDPFPASGSVNTVSHRQLYHSTGKIAMNGAHGCVDNITSGTTVPISITRPETFFYNSITSGDHANHWLTTSIHTLWGVGYEGSSVATTTGEGTNYGKSIFDPCPAGYRVPRREAKTWNLGSNTLHWGRENENLFTAMGNPTANIAVDYGFNWPTAYNSIPLPYKGGWYSTAGFRYTGGLHTNVGSLGNYWSSSAVSNNARRLYFSSGLVNPSHYNPRYFGFSVRCVAE